MTVVVDTSIWSLAFRRKLRDLKPGQEKMKWELLELIREGRARLLGPIRQEVLSGIREEAQFRRLREDLRAFEDEGLTTEDYEEAAEVGNRCRRVGVAGSPTDFLICACASRRNWAIYTTDGDFVQYAKHVPLRLHAARSTP